MRRLHDHRTVAFLGLALVLGPGCADVSAGGMPAPTGAYPQAPPQAFMPGSATRTVQALGGVATSVEFASRVEGISAAEPAEEKIAFHSSDGDEMGPAPGPPPPPPAPPPVTPAKPAVTPPSDPQGRGGEVAVVRGPLLIYTAQIAIAVFEVNTSLATVETIGKELGGFLAKRDDQSVTIRVPASRFEDAVKRIEKIGDMLHRNVTAEDVTEEFRDLDVRLKSARAVQARLLELLGKAVKVEESVLIEKELERVSGEIDRVEGRMKFLRDRAAYSTITVSFQAKSKDIGPAGPFRLPGRWLQELGLGRLLRL